MSEARFAEVSPLTGYQERVKQLTSTIVQLAYRATSIAMPHQEEKLAALCCVELTPKLLWKEGVARTADPSWNVVFRM